MPYKITAYARPIRYVDTLRQFRQFYGPRLQGKCKMDDNKDFSQHLLCPNEPSMYFPLGFSDEKPVYSSHLIRLVSFHYAGMGRYACCIYETKMGWMFGTINDRLCFDPKRHTGLTLFASDDIDDVLEHMEALCISDKERLEHALVVQRIG